MPYLFTHFKEKYTPDGEQVYFGISRDGLNWEQVNNGNPILTAELGEKGCRDIEIIRLKTGGFVILTTDLCVANRYDENLQLDWSNINRTGSKCLRMWKTDDLVNFSEEKLIYFGRDDFGCLWAPEIFYDELNDEYLIHWGSTVKEDDFSHMSIYCCTTKDFETLNFNTAISQMMIFINAVYKEEVFPKEYAEGFIKLFNPICPHITEEIWHEIFKHEDTIAYEDWPVYDETKIVEDTYTMIVQVNGKVRGKIEVASSTTEDEMKTLALEIENVKAFTDGKEVVKVIVVPKKLVNIVVK